MTTSTETTTVRTPRVFAVQHPDMSEALIMEDIAGRTHDQIIMWAQMHILRAFDVWPSNDDGEWAVVQLPSKYGEVAVPFDIFEEQR